VPFLAAAAVIAASYGSGMALSLGGRVAIDDPLRRRLTVFALGLGALALAVYGLGLAGSFDRSTLIAVTAAGAALAVPFAPQELTAAYGAWRRRRGRAWWVIAGLAVLLAFDVLLASAPPTSGDALAYHLASPKDWLEQGRIVPIWWSWNSFQPFSTEMHMALGLALDGARAAMVVAALLSAFSTFCVYGLVRDLVGRAAGLAAACLWVVQGMFVWEASGGFVELLLAGLVALAAWHLVSLRRTQRVTDAAWAGLALGLAAGVKYHALAFVPALAAWTLLAAAGPLRRRAVLLGAFCALAAVGAPWYVRNWVTAGNPVYPFAAGTFGGRYLDSASRYDLDQSLSGTGLPGIWRLPFFPLEFVLHTDRYERGYSLSPALFLLAPVGVVLGSRLLRVLALGIVAYLIVWWEVMQQITRYLLPILPFAAALAAAAGVELWRGGRVGRGYATVSAVVAAGAFLAIAGLFAWRILPGALGIESQARFVQRQTGTYDAFAWLDHRLPPSGRVLIGVRDLYWLDRPHAAFDVPYFSFEQPTRLTLERMRAIDVRYLAFVNGQLPPQLQPISRQLRLLARLDVPQVTSRTLGRVTHQTLVVWAWCAARGDPCARAAARADAA